MANPFVKAWRYLMALFSSKVDEYADPKVQIQQAIEEAQRQHQALTQQAAQVIGNQRQLEMRLNRQLADIEKLQVNVRQALTLADQATAAGDAAKATEYNNAAEAFAAQLVTAEQSVEDLKGLHDQALQAAGQAKKAVEQNAMVLQQKIAERTKLLSQLEQAKMQEQVSASLRSMSEIWPPRAIPRASTRCARRSNAATPTRWAPPSWRRTRCRAACSRCSRPACRWPGIPGSSRSAPRCAARLCLPGARARPPRPPRRQRRRRRRRSRSVSSQCRGMAVKSRATASRPEAWRSLVQRGVDTAAELSDVLAQKLSAAADPRAKQLRKRKWALRLGLFFTLRHGFWVAVTAVLASWSTPAWALFIPAPIAVGAAFLATLSFLRYRWLRGDPLPPQRSRATRRLPPWGSAARQPMAALAASERGLFSLIGVMERGRMLPADELRELTAAANQSAATMAATADEVVSMERAISRRSAVARSPGADDQRVHRPAGQRRPSVQRDGHRGSAIGVRGEYRSDVELADVAAAVPRRAGQRHRPADRLGAGVRRTRPSCAAPSATSSAAATEPRSPRARAVVR